VAVSDLIARFILAALDSADGYAVLQRGALAEQFDCVPSQINYVISTRFSPERGYLVESRRGGGGYIRIRRLRLEPGMLLIQIVNAVGGELSLPTAAAFVQNALDEEAIDDGSARLILAAIGNNALKPLRAEERDTVRASIFKQMLIHLIAND